MIIEPYYIPAEIHMEEMDVEGQKKHVYCFDNWGLGLVYFEDGWYLYHMKTNSLLTMLIKEFSACMLRICHKKLRGYLWRQDPSEILNDPDFKIRIQEIRSYIKKYEDEEEKDIEERKLISPLE